jgi:hypothetical protein
MRSGIQIPMAIITRFSVSDTKPSGTLLLPPAHRNAHPQMLAEFLIAADALITDEHLGLPVGQVSAYGCDVTITSTLML